MPPPPHSRPENVLKRAQELIGVGQSQAALSILHEHVVSKRTRNSPIASLEPVMLQFVELCVDLRRGKLAKDGLYQYKNTAQNTNVGTIETVFKKFIELAERKVTEAQAKADEVQSTLESTATTANVDDLEASETPESILLSTVSGEQSKDRTDRAIVTPWLKFLWETYRTVLDIFKNNARLEIMYQSTAHQAFQFCSKYARKTEFRRLCELLRNHLQNAAKFSQQMHAINLSDPDTLQRHLDTRFQQLNVAVELELWQEAFRSVEDIHTLLNLSKRPAKNIMMANYFEKLTRIFLVSENYLFHAAAWSRYYSLMRQSAAAVASGAPKKDNPAVTEADMAKAASFVLLSALSIPVISTTRSRGALVDVDQARNNKNVRLTNLLGMSSAPTRAVLFKDALSKGLIKRVRPEIRELYQILEVDFHPLSICQKISPILTQIGSDPELAKYILPLQQVILTRLFQQLSQVYESVELQFVLNLAQFPDPFQVSSSTIEKFIMNGCKKGDLAIRIDHATGVLTFDSDVFSSAKALHPGSGAGSAEGEASSVQRLQSTPAEIVRSQLTRLAKSLYITCQYVDPTFNEDRQKAKAAALARAQAGAEKEHAETLARREIIERKKQAASTALAQKEKAEATRKRLRAQELQEAEAKRLADEQREREIKRLELEKRRIQEEEVKRQLNELKQGVKGVDIDSLDISELDSGRIRAIKLRALEKEKTELQDKLRITGKRIDHLERAYRREEVKHLASDYKAQCETDRAAHEKATAETLKESKEKHTEAVAIKHRLSRLVDQYSSFSAKVKQDRHTEFEKQERAAKKALQQQMDQRRKEVKAKKEAERRRLEQEERERREQEEREAREAEERERNQAEERERLERIREEKMAERRKLDEKAALQRAKEAEAEAKIAAKKAGAAPPPTRVPERAPERAPERVAAPDTADGRPRLNLTRPTGKPSWREREAARVAGGEAPAAAAPPSEAPSAEAEAPKRSGYVPPHLRNRDGATAPPAAGGGGWRSREGSGRGPARDESPAGGSARYEAPARDAPPRTTGGPTKYVPRFRRDEGEAPANGERGVGMERQGSGAGGATDGKYRPGAFRSRQ